MKITKTAGTLAGLMACLAAGPAHAQKAVTPPMGWNSWNHFGCESGGPISEELFKQTADALVASGMKDAGYVYMNIDDCWHGPRSPNGAITASSKFTGNSMKTLSDYVHSKGLKFGIYTCVGTNTCAGKPGSLGFEDQDIATYASWGVDYVKIDWCSRTAQQTRDPIGAYKKFSDAIAKHKPDMVMSICNWGQSNPWTWGKRDAGGQLWRTTADIRLGWQSFTEIIDLNANLHTFAGPGGWNDPDMLEVGRGMSVEEDKSHFGMWCLMASPLIAGNDLRTMTTAAKAILTNTELIAVNQDMLGKQGQRVVKTGDLEVWAKPLAGNARAVGLFNRSTSAQTMTVNWSDLDKWSAAGLPWTADKKVTVRDLWLKQDVATDKAGSHTATVPPHGLAVFKLFDPSVSVGPVLSFRKEVRMRGDMLDVGLSGAYEVRILSLSGQTLWSKRGDGPARHSLPGLGAGRRYLQVLIPGQQSIRP